MLNGFAIWYNLSNDIPKINKDFLRVKLVSVSFIFYLSLH